MSSAGLLAALIPREYGGSGLGIVEASIILEEINRSGGNSAACHAQMYIMNVLTKHGSKEQKEKYLPKIASGELRLQAFGITEPKAGIDTTRIETFARKEGKKYIINGHKTLHITYAALRSLCSSLPARLNMASRNRRPMG